MRAYNDDQSGDGGSDGSELAIQTYNDDQKDDDQSDDGGSGDGGSSGSIFLLSIKFYIINTNINILHHYETVLC